MKNVLIIFGVVAIGVFIFYLSVSKKQSFFDIYGKDDKISKSLKEFRKLPLNKITVDSVEWTYLKIGSGEQTILFLHGMGGAYDIWWQQINYFKDKYRIISVTYPPVNNLEQMANTVIEILDNERVGKVIVIGSSLGGYFAQYLTSMYPERIEKVVFGNTFPPNDEIKQENESKESLFKTAPEWMVMWILRKGLSKGVLPAADNSPVLKAFMTEQYSGGMTKEQFIARYYCVIDKFDVEKTDLIPKVIIESDNDPLVNKNLRKKLKELYPEAKVETIHDGGHFPYVSNPEIYNKILENFFKEEQQENLEMKNDE
ncbi:MAG: alpha/beta hydrolase [Bacteroidales bacterium]|nr:alpha/beta hydrolase [Bacteroidales bacterium]